MATTPLEKKIATGNALVLDTAPAPVGKSRKRRLVDHWLIDENSKLYCKWDIEA